MKGMQMPTVKPRRLVLPSHWTALYINAILPCPDVPASSRTGCLGRCSSHHIASLRFAVDDNPVVLRERKREGEERASSEFSFSSAESAEAMPFRLGRELRTGFGNL